MGRRIRETISRETAERASETRARSIEIYYEVWRLKKEKGLPEGQELFEVAAENLKIGRKGRNGWTGAGRPFVAFITRKNVSTAETLLTSNILVRSLDIRGTSVHLKIGFRIVLTTEAALSTDHGSKIFGAWASSGLGPNFATCRKITASRLAYCWARTAARGVLWRLRNGWPRALPSCPRLLLSAWKNQSAPGK